MNLDLLKRNKESIIIGLLTSLIFFLFEKTIKILTESIFPALASISSTFSEIYYRAIGLNDTSSYIPILYYVLINIGVITYLIFINIFRNDIDLDISNLYDRSGDYGGLINNDFKPKINYKTYPTKYAYLSREESRSFFLKEFEKATRYNKLFHTMLLTTIIISYFIILYNISIDRLNIKFQGKLVALSPYLNSFQINIIKSKWVLMKNREDYNQIDSTLKVLLMKNKISM